MLRQTDRAVARDLAIRRDLPRALKVLAGFLSLTIAVLSGITTFLNPNEKENAHLNAAHGYDKLNNEARLFWSVECWQEESDLVLTSKLRELIDRKDVLNSGSPQIPGWAYQKAKKGIEEGEAKFEGQAAKLSHRATTPKPGAYCPAPPAQTSLLNSRCRSSPPARSLYGHQQ